MRLPVRQRIAGSGFPCLLIALLIALGPRSALAESGLTVVVSIAPVHSLVAGVMDNLGTPDLIVRGYGSPHGYQMRPSDAARIRRADVIFWVGEALETFLARSLASLHDHTKVVEFLALDGLVLYPARQGGRWAGHAPSGHGHGGSDPHVWLNPVNAKRMVSAIAQVLGEQDRPNAGAYAANAVRLHARIDALQADLAAQLRTVSATPYLVLHDAFQYLERHFGLHAAGALNVRTGEMPSAKRLKTLRELLETGEARCLFRETQVESAMVKALVAGTPARLGTLDALGLGIEPGPDAYFMLMRRNAGALVSCLGGD